MKGQRGQAFIMVLIMLTVGAVVIVPTLRYSSSAVISQRIAEETLTERYTADAALEDAIWNILYGSLIQDANDTETYPDGYTYDFTLDGTGSSITMEIPSVPDSEPYDVNPIYMRAEVVPNWLDTIADTTFTYFLRMENTGWDIEEYGVTLPPGLAYFNNLSYVLGPLPQNELEAEALVDLSVTPPEVEVKKGVNPRPMDGPEFFTEVYEWPPPGGIIPETSYVVVTGDPVTGQDLVWRPYFPVSGKRALVQTIQVNGIPPWGISYIEPWFLSTGQGLVQMEPTGALGVAVYTVTIDVEGTKVEVTLAVEADGTVVILSYQIL